MGIAGKLLGIEHYQSKTLAPDHERPLPHEVVLVTNFKGHNSSFCYYCTKDTGLTHLYQINKEINKSFLAEV